MRRRLTPDPEGLHYYSTNGNEDSSNDGDGDQKRDVKDVKNDNHHPPPKKRDVKGDDRKKHDVKGDDHPPTAPKKCDVKGDNRKKCDVKDVKGDDHPPTPPATPPEKSSAASRKRKRGKNSIEHKDDNNGKKSSDDSDELLVKRKKTSEVSLRKSAQVQKRKDDQRKSLAKLKIKRSKSMAGQFVLSEADCTYRAPKGLYGQFGVPEKNSIQGRTADHKEEEEEESSSSSTTKVVLKKPKEGFIENQLFDDDDDAMELSDETLKNNISRLSRISSDDLEMDELQDDSKRDVTNEKGKQDSKRDVNNPDVTNEKGKRDEMNLFKRDFKIPFHTSDDTYRVDNTPGIGDPYWRIKTQAYPVDNRGFGGHKQILNQMRDGDERDKELIQVLTNVVEKETSKEDNIVDVDNGDENENEDDDDDDGYGDVSDGNEGEETSQEETTQEETTPEETTPEETKSECSDTSAYASATDNITSTSPYDLSLSVESIEHQKGGKVKTDPGNFPLDKKPEEGKRVEDQEKVMPQSPMKEKANRNVM